jgi:hypothetical protein
LDKGAGSIHAILEIRSMTRRSKLVLLIAVAAVVAAALWIRSSPNSYPLLTTKATLVADTKGWLTWHWKSDHELLYVRKAGSKLVVNCLDVSTGRVQPLTALTSQLGKQGPGYSWSVSPDGNKLLSFASVKGVKTAFVLDLAGRTLARWSNAGQVHAWFPDGSAWWELKNQQGQLITVAHYLDGRSDRSSTSVVTNMGNFQSYDFGRVAKDGRFLVAYWDCYRFPTSLGYNYVTPGLPPPPIQTLSWKNYGPLSNLSISRDGTRIAVQARQDQGWVSGLFRSMHSSKEAGHESIWVNRFPQGEWKVLGEIEVRYKTDYDTDLTVGEWLPGNRKLSFTLEGKLYTIPVDGP